MLPEQLEKVLQQVQASADYMPEWQLEVSNTLSARNVCIFLVAHNLYHINHDRKS